MITCYVLQRQKKDSLNLVPYWEIEDDLQLDSLVIKTSGMLNKQQKDAATIALYTAIDFGVDRWIQNKRYIPRLLLSALVFTVSYFFLSLVIRDPIPMVDELLISFGLALFSWISIAKRDTRSSIAQYRRHELKLVANKAEEAIDTNLFELEQYLDELSNIDAYELAQALCRIPGASLPEPTFSFDKQELTELMTLLQANLKRSQKTLYRMLATVNASRKRDVPNPRLAASLFHQTVHKNLDLALLAFTVLLMETI